MLGLKEEMGLDVITFARAQSRLVCRSPPGEHAHAGILPVFREAVIELELLFLAAELRGALGAEVVRERQEDLRAEGLQKRSPRFAGQGGPERTHALGRHNRDAEGLPRERKELLVARWIVFADCGERVV